MQLSKVALQRKCVKNLEGLRSQAENPVSKPLFFGIVISFPEVQTSAFEFHLLGFETRGKLPLKFYVVHSRNAAWSHFREARSPFVKGTHCATSSMYVTLNILDDISRIFFVERAQKLVDFCLLFSTPASSGYHETVGKMRKKTRARDSPGPIAYLCPSSCS